MTKRIMFIGHEASRTGAPVVFLSLLRWLRAHASFDMKLLLLRGGPLLSSYEAVLPTSVLGHTDGSSTTGKTANRLRSLLYAIALRLPFRRFLINVRNHVRRSRQRSTIRTSGLLSDGKAIDLLYCNSVASLHVLRENIPSDIPIIVHVHEMALGIRYGLKGMSMADLTKRRMTFIAAGPMVLDALAGQFGIDPAHVSVVYPGVEDIDPSAWESRAADARRSLGIASDAVVVGMVGTVDWRKGADLFVQIAKIVAQQSSKDVHFLWVGGSAEYETFKKEWHLHLVVPDHLVSCVHFVGEQPDALPYISAMDIFALTSREDPFPLVALEAGLLQKPVVCFEKSGGAAMWVSDGAGFVATHLDVHDFARHVVQLIDDSDLCRSCGERAQKIVRERYLIDVSSRKILTIIEEVLETKRK